MDLKQEENKMGVSLTRLERLNEMENQYQIFCGSNQTTDKRILEWGAKCLVLFSVLIFAMVSVVKHDENQALFLNLIVLILSVFLPTPSIKKPA